MNSILISVVDKAFNGSYHCKLFIDEKESGIFYLNPSQLKIFCDTLKNGSYETGVKFSLENPYDDFDENDVDDDFDNDDEVEE